MPELVPGLDLLVSPSARGEAFLLLVGEAMASGVPYLATDIGDCSRFVSDTGEIAPPGCTAALTASLARLLAVPSRVRPANGRRA